MILPEQHFSDRAGEEEAEDMDGFSWFHLVIYLLVVILILVYPV